ncbi:nuclease-related domain-containing protein [Planococcus sp. 1R117A]|uniref:nuclease-related domain-containing protein n=1 Tax=Planococcus sp. 1R117A TaxID=3447020 RepID=UPI003EDC4BFD
MILKPRGTSLERERLEVLLRRLPRTHALYKEVKEDFYNDSAGIGGEQRFDDYVAASRLPFPHIFLHNVSLKSLLPFQLDSLMITPWCIYVFEVKNMSGRLRFEQSPLQLIQTKEDGTIIGRKSPIEQIDTNEWLLEEWLRASGVHLPLRSVLVLSYPKQIPENVPATHTVLFSHQLPMFLNKIKSEKEILDFIEMTGLANEILAAHSYYVPKPICSNPAYPIQAMIRGVWCAACDRIGMKRKYGTWHCPSCGESDKNAHIQSIKDWHQLTGKPMTNKICREFLQIEDRRLTTRLLTEMNLIKQGHLKGTNYVF